MVEFAPSQLINRNRNSSICLKNIRAASMCPRVLFLFQEKEVKLSFTCQPRKALSVKGYAHNLYDLCLCKRSSVRARSGALFMQESRDESLIITIISINQEIRAKYVL